MNNLTEIKPEDLIIQNFPHPVGGFCHNVEKGVTVHHKPTNTTIDVDRHRSQHRNKNECIIILQDLLTEFKVGDIVVTPKGICEVFDIGEVNDIYCVDEEGKHIPQTYTQLIAHTEEGYRYKHKLILEEEIKTLQDDYNREVGVLREKLREVL